MNDLQITGGFDEYDENIAVFIHANTREARSEAKRKIREILKIREEGYLTKPKRPGKLTFDTQDAAHWLATDVLQLVEVDGWKR